MKKFFITIILSLCLTTPSQADDIRDFQIEGISLGDSMLDYFSEEEIKKNIRHDGYKGSDGAFIDANLNYFPFYKIYDGLQIVFKPNDNDYIIYSIAGGIFYGQDIKACLKKQKELDAELSDLFKNSKRVVQKEAHKQDPSGKSTWHAITYYFKSGGKAEIACYDWSEEMKNQDYLSVAIDTKKFDKWLHAYYGY
jgi:hypothetical protein